MRLGRNGCLDAKALKALLSSRKTLRRIEYSGDRATRRFTTCAASCNACSEWPRLHVQVVVS